MNFITICYCWSHGTSEVARQGVLLRPGAGKVLNLYSLSCGRENGECSCLIRNGGNWTFAYAQRAHEHLQSGLEYTDCPPTRLASYFTSRGKDSTYSQASKCQAVPSTLTFNPKNPKHIERQIVVITRANACADCTRALHISLQLLPA